MCTFVAQKKLIHSFSAKTFKLTQVMMSDVTMISLLTLFSSIASPIKSSSLLITTVSVWLTFSIIHNTIANLRLTVPPDISSWAFFIDGSNCFLSGCAVRPLNMYTTFVTSVHYLHNTSRMIQIHFYLSYYPVTESKVLSHFHYTPRKSIDTQCLESFISWQQMKDKGKYHSKVVWTYWNSFRIFKTTIHYF